MPPEILDRLAALEQQVSEFLPAAFERRRSGIEPAGHLMAQVRARAEMHRNEAPMSIAEVAEIRIDGEITREMATAVCDQLHAARLSPTINVVFDTEGGEYAEAERIFRAILWHPATTKRALLKKCMSAGVFAMMACDKRIASPDTQILIHMVEGKPDPQERWNVFRHIEQAHMLRALDARMLNIIADRSGASDLQALAAEAATESLSSLQWCLANGLIHTIEEPV
ncbi:hypothetical protein A9174_24990 [Mesorhizobium loti NZP2037]|nr:ATP-dependent Clp protease proteolytic subunit [Mesorhizobium loti]ANN59651.1 hypothetical protein A9174_24990 [Mesorhizobium loti NZP2037]